MGCQLHELIGRVVKSRAWSGVWQVEVFQRHDDVYRGDIRVEVALAKVHVHVELLFTKFANLPEGRNFFEEGMVESVLGEEAGQISRRIVVPVVERRSLIRGLEHANFHGVSVPPEGRWLETGQRRLPGSLQ